MRNLIKFHKIFGLFVAYIGFFFFFSGALGYYKDEISTFMQPKIYKLDYKNSDYIKIAFEFLQKNHPNDARWIIYPPNFINPYIKVISQKEITNEKIKKLKFVALNPQNGEIIDLDKNFGGKFLAELHFKLWYLSKNLSGKIVAYFGIFMLFVIIIGILIHNRIFKDFFKLKNKTFWFDMHILMGVSGFIIFVLLIFSGLYIAQKDILKGKVDSKIKTFHSINTDFIPQISDVKEIIAKNSKDREILSVEIKKTDLTINFNNKNPFESAGKGNYVYEIYDFNGSMIKKSKPQKMDYSKYVVNFMKIYHKKIFGGEAVKFMFFIFGIFGALMCFSGVYLWYKKNHSNLVKNIAKTANISIFIGLFSGLGFYLLSNQLSFKNETDMFFAGILLMFLISFLKNGYKIASIFTSVLFMILFILVALKGGFENFAVLEIEIFILIVAFGFGIFALKRVEK